MLQADSSSGNKQVQAAQLGHEAAGESQSSSHFSGACWHQAGHY